MLNNNVILEETKNYVRETLQHDCTGHDWWHINRVWKTAVYIAKKEKADLFIVQLAALLHDIGDWKFNNNNDEIGIKTTCQWLEKWEVKKDIITHVADIIRDMSFKGADVTSKMKTLEGKIVQDADRLDAMGAIGIARTFAYGGYKGRPLYDPIILPQMHDTFESYKNAKGTTINHFYEKLLLLKDLMNTVTGKTLAQKKHHFMENFLTHFFSEWNGDY